MLNEFLAGLPLYLAVSLSIIIIIVDSLSGKNKIITYIFSIITFIAIIVAAFYTYFGADLIQIDINTSFTRGMISYGGLPSLFDIIFAVSALLTVIAGMPYLKREFDDFKEFYTLILFSTTGMMMIAHANHLIMIFIGIELMSISFYVLSGFIRVRITAVEAALKYFLLGSFATGFLLYGMALIYGSTQTMYLSEIHLVLMSGSVDFTFLRAGFAEVVFSKISSDQFPAS